MSVKILTNIPGPRSLELSNKRAISVARGHGTVCNVFIKKGEGSLLTDVDGNVFIDFAGGIGTINIGHSHPKVINAINKQVENYLHTCFTVAPYESYIKLAEKLSSLVPIDNPCKAAFFNSGAEAVENAVKIARSYTNRAGVLVFSHAYHGRTLMTMSMTYKEDPYKKGFGPFAPEIYTLPYPSNEKGLILDSIDFDPKKIACAVIEPVIGEGGFIPASKSGMSDLKDFCNKYDILLVIDEVQTGFGRTGSLFAIEQYDIEPDMITIAKSIAGGLPLSGVLGRKDIMDSVHIGGIGGTYSGNPVSCEAALAVLEIMEEEELPKNANKIGHVLRSRVENIIPECPWIKEIRGLGAMLGIEIINNKTGEPDKERTNRIHHTALKNGLIMITAGTYSNVIRTLMPLTIDDNTLNEGVDILVNALMNH